MSCAFSLAILSRGFTERIVLFEEEPDIFICGHAIWWSGL
jgi:hypothetical protein